MGKIGLRFSMITALVFSFITIVFVGIFSYYHLTNGYSCRGEAMFGAWVHILLWSILSLLFYCTDLVLMVAFKKVNKHNIVITVILFIQIVASVPVFLAAGDNNWFYLLNWVIYYLFLVALEIIYFVRYLRSEPR